MAEDPRGPKQTAGQRVRMVDVPPVIGKLGVFENLDGFVDGEEFSKHLQAASYRFYGTPIRAFLASIAPNLGKVATEAKSAIKGFVKDTCPAGSSGQVSRVCNRFGLIAAGGELAIRLKILPWPEGEAEKAAKICFRAWLDARGGNGASEDLQGVNSVRNSLAAHHSARFMPAWESPRKVFDGESNTWKEVPEKIINLAGYRKRAVTLRLALGQR
jgi:putative DNA primase/helicase